MSESVIELAGFTAGYQGQAVVHDLDLTVGAGEVVALLGANGAGKTTTLLGLSGLADRLDGEVRLHGDVVTRRPAHEIARRGLAHVPEDRALFADLTTLENLHLGMHRRRGGVDAALDLCPELRPLLPRRAGLLSGGEQQMLALARAVAGGPRALLVDEMSLGLAPLVVERLLGVLQRIGAEAGCAVLLVEQHVELALEIADRGYVLARGRITLAGSADMLRRESALVEASYLGDLGETAAAAAVAGAHEGEGGG